MLTEAELAEMLEIRRKIDALQARYNELAAKMAAAGAGGQSQQSAVASPPAEAKQLSGTMSQSSSTAGQSAGANSPPPSDQAAVLPAPGKSEQPSPEQGQNPVASVQSPDRSKWAVKDYIVDILRQAGKPLPFDDIYKRLEATHAPLPKEKPMLAVRQILYNRSLFTVGRGGLFSLINQPSSGAADSQGDVKNGVKAAITESQLFKYRINALKSGMGANK